MAYIDAERAKRIIIKTEWKNKGIPLAFCQMIDLMPTADVEEVKHGCWNLTKTEFGWNGCEYPTEYTCTVCGGISPCCEEPYCPNCGAKMDGRRDT